MTEQPKHSLEAWGWNEDWEAKRADVGRPELIAGRVVIQEREFWSVVVEEGVVLARLLSMKKAEVVPAVGDWVLLRRSDLPSDPWLIESVLPRISKFSRGSVGKRSREQVVAANVDRVWIVHGLDIEPRPRKLERFLALAWESGATPSVVLTKADVASEIEASRAIVAGISGGAEVHVVSVEDETALAALRGTLEPGMTVALLGPSGVGKSTLINRLAGEDLTAAGEVREKDRKGRHTTTRRQLFRLPGGYLMLDTPGMRELQVWELEEGLSQAFPEVSEVAARCRFRDCSHESEPGCAVLAALEEGSLSRERYESYRKLQSEHEYQQRKNDPRLRAEAESEWKAIRRSLKHHPKYKKRGR